MKTMLNALLILIALIFPALTASAEGMPHLLFESGEKTELTLNQTISVHSDLIQIQIGPHSILTAKKGDEFQIRQAGSDGLLSIAVDVGHVTLYDLAHNHVVHIKPGSMVTGPNPVSCNSPVSTDCFEFRANPEGAATGPELKNSNIGLAAPPKNLALSSFVMTKQQHYLDSLQIDVRDINNVLSSILRGLGSNNRPQQP